MDQQNRNQDFLKKKFGQQNMNPKSSIYQRKSIVRTIKSSRSRREETTGFVFQSFFWSLMIGFFNVGNPLFTGFYFANNLQTQNLYAAWAMSQGDLVYNNIFGTSSLLYYLVNWCGYLLIGNLIFMVLEILALWISGYYAFLLADYIVECKRSARNVLNIFYFSVFSLGFGGTYSGLLTLPLVLWGLCFIVRYTEDIVKDEAFFLYGGVGAFIFLIDAHYLLLHILSFVFLLGYNFSKKKFWNGFYQLFASLTGFSIVFYTTGYYTILSSNYDAAISQLVYHLTSFNMFGSNFLESFALYSLIVFSFGFLAASGYTLVHIKRKLVFLEALSLLGFFVSFFVSLSSLEKGFPYQLILCLPFSLILLTVWLHGSEDLIGGEECHCYKRNQLGTSFRQYITRTLYFSVIAFIYFSCSPFVHRILNRDILNERQELARYIARNTSLKDRIYVWDDTASIYLDSKRLSAAPILTPSLYLSDNLENQIHLENRLKEGVATYIVVNNGLSLTSNTANTLTKKYIEVNNLNLRYFKLYKKN